MSKQVKKPFYEVVCQEIILALASIDQASARAKARTASHLLNVLANSRNIPSGGFRNVARNLKEVPGVLRENDQELIALVFEESLEMFKKKAQPAPIRGRIQPFIFISGPHG